MKKRLGGGVIVVMVLTALFMGFCEAKKAGLHEDEAYTITSSVSPVWEGIMATAGEDGAPILKTREEYESYAYFSGFDPVLVYINQARDVHPPLYYLIFHVLAVIFQRWTFQIAFLVNLICFLMMEWMIVEILVLLGKEKAILPTLVLVSFSVLGINLVTFQRMYMMMGMFVMLALYFNLKIWRDDFKMSRGMMIGLGATIVLGFLTQYFFVIYLVGLFGVMCVKMWRAKKFESLKKYVLLHVGMGVLGVALYPASLAHIFASYRGVGALVGSSMTIGERLAGFLKIVRENIYIPFLVVLGILVVWWAAKKEKYAAMMILPALIYLGVTVVLAPFIEVRYFMPVMAVVVMGVVIAAGSVLGGRMLMGAAMVLALGGALVCRPTFLYEEYAKLVEVAEENREKALVYVTDNDFTFVKNLREFLTYEETAVVKTSYDEIRKLPEMEGEFVLRMDNWVDREKVLAEFREQGYGVERELPVGDYVGYVMKAQE